MKSPPRGALLALALGLLGACVGSAISEPEANHDSQAKLFGGGGSNPTLIQCPTSQTTSGSALITALGGVLSVGGASITVPAGALLGPSLVTVTVPASQFVEVDITVAGQEHFLFELPVVVTISYARCPPGAFALDQLSAWYIDSETYELLEDMGGIDNKLTRTVTFTTDHLSGYAVAN